MAYENMTLREYFSLKHKESFSIDPWHDNKIYFGDSQLVERIKRRIETDFVQPRGVPKFFVLGAYGSGKTHTLAYIAYELGLNTMHPAEPIYLDIAPLGARERFQRLLKLSPMVLREPTKFAGCWMLACCHLETTLLKLLKQMSFGICSSVEDRLSCHGNG